VLVAPVSVQGIDDEAQVLRVNLTREQIEHAPPIDRAKPVSRQYEEAHYGYFRLAPYWDTVPGPSATAVPYPGTAPSTTENTQPASMEQPEETHLRSRNELIGYTIAAQDGEIGHVDDLVIDDEEWRVQYVEVDTRDWLPGKKVLVDIGRIRDISWARHAVSVALMRHAIESAPPYHPTELITPDYEVELFKHYSQGKSQGKAA
jgi:sporulation protein YlmC with PRC-barrel domain